MKQVLQTTWSTKAISTVNWQVLKKGAVEMGKVAKVVAVGQHSELYSKGGKKQRARWYRYPQGIRASKEERDDIVDMVKAVGDGYKYKPVKVFTSEIGDTFAEATLGKDGEKTGEDEEQETQADQPGFESD